MQTAFSFCFADVDQLLIKFTNSSNQVQQFEIIILEF